MFILFELSSLGPESVTKYASYNNWNKRSPNNSGLYPKTLEAPHTETGDDTGKIVPYIHQIDIQVTTATKNKPNSARPLGIEPPGRIIL
jgi:hypothetical protein